MKKGFIYIIKNKINSKIYIGQTKVSMELRWKEHLRHASYGNQLINRAMKKHGCNNFYIEVLETCEVSEIDNREIFYIELFDSTNKTKGYNVSIGGNTPRFKRPNININLLIDLYINQNYTLEKLSKYFNTTRYIIYTELINNNINIRKRGLTNCKYNTVSKSQLLKLIEQGFSMRAAAKQVNLPYSTFRKCCSYHKIEYNSSTSVQHPL